jgi:hypothetical protein
MMSHPLEGQRIAEIELVVVIAGGQDGHLILATAQIDDDLPLICGLCEKLSDNPVNSSHTEPVASIDSG